MSNHKNQKISQKFSEKKEAKDREIIQLIQSRCVHRRQGIVKDSDNVLYCQDCEKVLYGKEQK